MNFQNNLFIANTAVNNICPNCGDSVKNSMCGTYMLFHVSCGIQAVYQYVYSSELVHKFYVTPSLLNVIFHYKSAAWQHIYTNNWNVGNYLVSIENNHNLLVYLLEYFIHKTKTPTLKQILALTNSRVQLIKN